MDKNTNTSAAAQRSRRFSPYLKFAHLNIHREGVKLHRTDERNTGSQGVKQLVSIVDPDALQFGQHRVRFEGLEVEYFDVRQPQIVQDGQVHGCQLAVAWVGSRRGGWGRISFHCRMGFVLTEKAGVAAIFVSFSGAVTLRYYQTFVAPFNDEVSVDCYAKIWKEIRR